MRLTLLFALAALSPQAAWADCVYTGAKRPYIECIYNTALTASYDLVDQAAALVGLDTRLSGAEAGVAGLQTDLFGLQGDLAATQGDVTSLESGLAATQASLTGTQGDVAALQGDFMSTQASLTGTQASLTGTQGDVAALQGDLMSTQASLSGTQASLTGTQGDVAALQGDLMSTQASLSGTQGELATAQSDLVGLSAALSTLEGVVAGVLTSLADLASDLGVVSGDIAALQAATADLSTTVDTLEAGEFGGLSINGANVMDMFPVYRMTANQELNGTANAITGWDINAGAGVSVTHVMTVSNNVPWASRSAEERALLTAMGRAGTQYIKSPFRVYRMSWITAGNWTMFQHITQLPNYTVAAFTKLESGQISGHWAEGATTSWRLTGVHGIPGASGYDHIHPTSISSSGSILVAMPAAVAGWVDLSRPINWGWFPYVPMSTVDQ